MYRDESYFLTHVQRIGLHLYTHSFFSLHHAYTGQFSIHICISSYMKRTNPKTKLPFKRGDLREDGYVFFNYTSKLKSDGFFLERWLNPESSEAVKTKDKLKKKATYQRKSDRHSPGFGTLTNEQKRTINALHRLNAEMIQYKDLTEADIIECLIGFELDGADLLDAAIQHAGKLEFDAKDIFHKVLNL